MAQLYNTLTEAIPVMKDKANRTWLESELDYTSNEFYNLHVRMTLCSRALDQQYEIAEKFQLRRTEMYAYFLEKFPEAPTFEHDQMTWYIGRTVLMNIPIIAYYQDVTTETFSKEVEDWLVEQWADTRIDLEITFRHFLRVNYGYDDYRCLLELDLLIDWTKIEFDLQRSITVSYTFDDSYDLNDFLCDLVELIVSPLVAAFEIIMYNEYTLFASLVLFTFVLIPAIEASSLVINADFAYNEGVISDMVTGQALTVGSFSTILKAEFGAFLETIHWSTLVSVHNIGLIVSEDYREIWAGVEEEISKLSEALGLGPYYMNLILRNTRNLVLDVSTTLGMKYDLAQVQWLAVFSEYSKVLSARAFRYRDDPSLILSDLDELVDRKLSDGKGGFMSTVVSTVDAALVAIEGIADNLGNVRNDLDRLADQMPEDMGAFVKEYTDPLIKKFDDFIVDTYDPAISTLDSAYRALNVAKIGLRNDLDATIDRLKKPADYLLEIDDMSDEDREEQEDKLEDLMTRPLGKDSGEIGKLSQPSRDELEGLKDLLEIERELPSWHIEEIVTPYRPSKVKAKPRETWYVGDY